MSSTTVNDQRKIINEQFENLPKPSSLEWIEIRRKIFFIAKSLSLTGLQHGLLREFGPLGWAAFLDTNGTPIEIELALTPTLPLPDAHATAGECRTHDYQAKEIEKGNNAYREFQLIRQCFQARFLQYLGPTLQLEAEKPDPFQATLASITTNISIFLRLTLQDIIAAEALFTIPKSFGTPVAEYLTSWTNQIAMLQRINRPQLPSTLFSQLQNATAHDPRFTEVNSHFKSANHNDLDYTFDLYAAFCLDRRHILDAPPLAAQVVAAAPNEDQTHAMAAQTPRAPRTNTPRRTNTNTPSKYCILHGTANHLTLDCTLLGSTKPGDQVFFKGKARIASKKWSAASLKFARANHSGPISIPSLGMSSEF